MRPQPDKQPPGRGASRVGDPQIAALAARQLGVVTRAQLLAAGFGPGAITHRRRSGRLHQLHRGVYLVGHEVRAAGARELAAVFAVGGDALLSHRSAAEMWGLLAASAGVSAVHVTAVGRQLGRRPRITTHRTPTLERTDRRRLGPIPLTSPSRTVVDLAGSLDSGQLEQAIAEAERSRRASRQEIARALSRAGHRHGAATLKALLADTRPSPAHRPSARCSP